MNDQSAIPRRALPDIETIRRDARKHIEEGAVTPTYAADREQVIKLLNEALATEIVCVLRYRHDYFIARGLKFFVWRIRTPLRVSVCRRRNRACCRFRSTRCGSPAT